MLRKAKKSFVARSFNNFLKKKMTDKHHKKLLRNSLSLYKTHLSFSLFLLRPSSYPSTTSLPWNWTTNKPVLPWSPAWHSHHCLLLLGRNSLFVFCRLSSVESIWCCTAWYSLHDDSDTHILVVPTTFFFGLLFLFFSFFSFLPMWILRVLLSEYNPSILFECNPPH